MRLFIKKLVVVSCILDVKLTPISSSNKFDFFFNIVKEIIDGLSSLYYNLKKRCILLGGILLVGIVR